MQINQWNIIGDELPTRSSIELKDSSFVVEESIGN